VDRGLEAWRTSKDIQLELEAQAKSTSSPPRSPGAVCLRLDAQATYGVRFRRSIYGWKANFIELPMALVLHPNEVQVNRNRQIKMAFRICPGAASPYFGLWAVYRR